jgi:hypothetical protein
MPQRTGRSVVDAKHLRRIQYHHFRVFERRNVATMCLPSPIFLATLLQRRQRRQRHQRHHYHHTSTTHVCPMPHQCRMPGGHATVAQSGVLEIAGRPSQSVSPGMPSTLERKMSGLGCVKGTHHVWRGVLARNVFVRCLRKTLFSNHFRSAVSILCFFAQWAQRTQWTQRQWFGGRQWWSKHGRNWVGVVGLCVGGVVFDRTGVHHCLPNGR